MSANSVYVAPRTQLSYIWLACAKQKLIYIGHLRHCKACDCVAVVHQVHSCASLQIPQPDGAIIMTCMCSIGKLISESSLDIKTSTHTRQSKDCCLLLV